jgi:Holliday junction resolvasome RuvABC DNA-binding subunit
MCRFNWFDRIIAARRAEDRREDDAVQMLMDLGYSATEVIEVRNQLQLTNQCGATHIQHLVRPLHVVCRDN